MRAVVFRCQHRPRVTRRSGGSGRCHLVVVGGPTRARGMSLAFIRKAADKPAARQAVLAHPHDDAHGVDEREFFQELADVVGDVGIRAEEDAQQIVAAHDAGQLALRVDDRQPPDAVRIHHPRRARDGRVRADGDGLLAHQRASGQREELVAFLARENTSAGVGNAPGVSQLDGATAPATRADPVAP